MLEYEDVHFQLVDLPPVSGEFMEPWLVATMQPAAGVLLVIDINDPECVEQIPVIMARLAEKKIILRERWPGLPGEREELTGEGDPFRLDLPTLLIANKCDLDPDSAKSKFSKSCLDCNSRP